MADVTREEAERLVEALDAARYQYENDETDDFTAIQRAKSALIAALTRPAPSPSDVDVVELARVYQGSVSCSVVLGEPHPAVVKGIRAVLARMRGAAVPEWRTMDTAPKGEVIQLRFGNGEVLPGWWTGGSFVAGYEPGWLAVSPEPGYQAFKCTMPEAWAPLLAAAPEVPR